MESNGTDGCETWHIALREDDRLTAYGERMLNKGPVLGRMRQMFEEVLFSWAPYFELFTT
jgi:hypothetical protein